MNKIINNTFGRFKDSDVILTSLFGGNNTCISIMNWGASIQNWTINNSENISNSVVLGFENFDYYPKYSPYFGSIIGRTINRINRGRFSLSEKKYQLDINRPPNHLHGGETGFGKLIWDFEINQQDNSVSYFIQSKDGEGGYPGNVEANVKYQLDDQKLKIEIRATTDCETPINMGQHNYFNLSSTQERPYNICNHYLYLNSSKFTETNQHLIPTGTILPTLGTEMDFSISKEIGEIELDDNFILNKAEVNSELSAKLYNPNNGLTLNLWTDQPGIQVYNSPKLDIKVPGLNNITYKNFSGICLEAQKFPDSVNHNHFPPIIVSPNNPYFHKTEIEIL